MPALNITAVLTVAVVCELVLYRVLQGAFLPNQKGTLVERGLSEMALFASHFAGILALLMAVVGLFHALRTDQVFPRSMRITVSTIGLFFCALAGLGVLWFQTTARYNIHLRISHGFLMFFMAVGIWHGARPMRAKLGITLFALPYVLGAIALFSLRMGWSRLEPASIVRLANAVDLAAMTATPVLLAPLPLRGKRLALALGTWIVLATALGAVTALRFDVVQAVAYYGLHLDLTGIASSAERVYTGGLIVAFASLGAATVTCIAEAGRHRLIGWGLILMAATGTDVTSAKAALFTLCGLLALAIGSVSQPQTVASDGV